MGADGGLLGAVLVFVIHTCVTCMDRLYFSITGTVIVLVESIVRLVIQLAPETLVLCVKCLR